jgi:argininosuccinate lyase
MSEIGKRLAQLPADEIREIIYRPQLTQVDGDDFKAMLDLNKAHLVMLAECGLIDAATARQLAQALLKMSVTGLDVQPDAGAVDTLLEDAYFAFETRLAAVAGTHAAGTLHLARSRNDIGATLDRMRARSYALRIAEGLLEVRSQCVTRAFDYTELILPGYTHLQPAQPISFAYYLSGYETALERDSQRLVTAAAGIDECALGVAALAGSGFAIDRRRTAQLLGFEGITRHGLDTVASRDFMLELLSAVNLLGVTWSRIAQDFHVFVSDEFAVLELPDRVSGISSIMPQKKNPIALEFLKAQSARITGALMGSITAVRGTHFSVSLDAMREGLADGWAVLKNTPAHLSLLRLVMESVAPRAQALEDRCNRNFSTATDLADALVRHCGLSFREAHHIVGGAVRLALQLGRDATGIDAALLDQAAQSEIGKPLGLPDALIAQCRDARQALLQRTTPGGAAPSAVLETLRESQRRLQQTREQLAARRQTLAQADAALESALQAVAANGR